MSEEREMLRATVAALVEKHANPEAVRAAIESEKGYDENLWQLLCEQVGAAALIVPEELGGAGGELGDAAVVLEELAKGLVPTPLLGTMLAELALLAVGDEEPLEGLAEGTSIGTVVFDAGYVINGDIADVVIAAQDGQLSRWTDVTVTPATAMDPTRRLAAVAPGSTAALGADPGLADTAAILMAVEQVAAASRCLDLTVAYSKDRVQFGRPIGSFQALKHRMSDLYVKVSAARSIVNDAIADPTPTNASLARYMATEAFNAVAGEAIQMHGGIAITWESDIQFYFKRAHGSAQLLGSSREHLRRLEAEVLH
ncbi:acyl-CoA dehydrogenase [Mycobacterium sp. CBMA293]|uniref:acyl-CoA dehydrogenase IpdE2 n=1 Tax=unclassified Mycolicibacterium TaxID=2636767 RepID=UPI0012DEBFB2|nr:MULTISPECIES: acyl-CoA dehydrogenase family protein [unclassified Mycolicibacterium]MUL46206.1 acyl-CoA dehydrogenase [Mycolicibacterium sp. CBMA 360]MUL58743.1 acyl-CoA dehydrogenase [Mycolicibacterium sp. CBMA 335]MUL69137.1 acyl-CoA dehydrogenase [Mycolicibacterium sp. CBMA 311]MUL94101.1 acyl-CoA dehydrogenase [Mycolicibacterium sp. CBMA 230]MUM05113.1 acyl-CoA dehydrogenase [Mycolicibacterium sp. CBMA 213]